GRRARGVGLEAGVGRRRGGGGRRRVGEGRRQHRVGQRQRAASGGALVVQLVLGRGVALGVGGASAHAAAVQRRRGGGRANRHRGGTEEGQHLRAGDHRAAALGVGDDQLGGR